MSADRPYFSILIPTYRCGELILEALASLAAQTEDDFEVVVLDDGSGEDTAELCESQDLICEGRYRFVRGDHQGTLQARRWLHGQARGEVVLYLDSDDMLCNRHALSLIRARMEDGCDVLMFNATRDLDSMQRFVDYAPLEADANGDVEVRRALEVLCTSGMLNNLVLKAYRRHVGDGVLTLGHLGMLQYAEDRLQGLVVLSAAKRIAVLDEILYYYRPNPNSITRAMRNPIFLADSLRVQAELRPWAQRLGVRDAWQQDLAAIVVRNLSRDVLAIPDADLRREYLAEARKTVLACDFLPRRAPIGTRPDRAVIYQLLRNGDMRALDAALTVENELKRVKAACLDLRAHHEGRGVGRPSAATRDLSSRRA